jgi:hypothetical protein
MPDIVLRTGEANPNDVRLTDPTVIAATVTVASSQAAQTEAAAGLLVFKAASAGAQAAQAGTGTGTEDFIATAAGAQGVQTEAGTNVLAFRATAAASQGVQTEAGTGLLAFVASAAGSQAAQTEAAAAVNTASATPVEETSTSPRHGPPLGSAIVKGPAGNRTRKPVFLVIAGGRQQAQREQVALLHAENEDWLVLGEELAA